MARALDIRSDLPPPRPAAELVRQHILDEAAHLFLTEGYNGTTLRRIAAAVGMKAGSIYHHVASKDDMLEEILVRGIEVMVHSFHHAAETTNGAGARTRLAAHIRAHLGSLFEHGPYTATHVTAFPYAPAGVRERIVPIRDGYEALWTELLAGLAAAGEIECGPSVQMTRLILMGSMNSSIEWFDPRGDRSVDQLADAITWQFCSAVGAAPDEGDTP